MRNCVCVTNWNRNDIQVDEEANPCTGGAKKIKAMSPGNLPLPPGGSWDSSGMVMSPFAPDMNSIASGSYMQGYGGGNGNPGTPDLSSSSMSNNLTRSNSFDFGGSDLLGGPLSQLADSVNSLDPLSSIERTINDTMPAPPARPCEGQTAPLPPNPNSKSHNQNPHTPQTGPHTPHTPHTPGGGGQAHTPAGSGPPSVGPNHCTPPGNNNNSCNNDAVPDTTSTDLGLPSDLNFDPEAVINGEGTENETLNVRNHIYTSNFVPLHL